MQLKHSSQAFSVHRLPLGQIMLHSQPFHIYSRQGSNLIQLQFSEPSCKSAQSTWSSWIVLLPLLASPKAFTVLALIHIPVSVQSTKTLAFFAIMTAGQKYNRNIYITKICLFSLNMAYFTLGNWFKTNAWSSCQGICWQNYTAKFLSAE